MSVKGRLCAELSRSDSWYFVHVIVNASLVEFWFLTDWIRFYILRVFWLWKRCDWKVTARHYRSCFCCRCWLVGVATDDVVRWKMANWVSSRSISASLRLVSRLNSSIDSKRLIKQLLEYRRVSRIMSRFRSMFGVSPFEQQFSIFREISFSRSPKRFKWAAIRVGTSSICNSSWASKPTWPDI